jgi:hypothetical protein
MSPIVRSQSKSLPSAAVRFPQSHIVITAAVCLELLSLVSLMRFHIWARDYYHGPLV